MGEAAHAFQDIAVHDMFHFAGVFFGEIFIDAEDALEKVFDEQVAVEQAAGFLTAGIGEADGFVWCVLDVAFFGELVEGPGDGAFADIEGLGDLVGVGGVIILAEPVDGFKVVFEAGTEFVVVHGFGLVG